MKKHFNDKKTGNKIESRIYTSEMFFCHSLTNHMVFLILINDDVS